MADLRRRVHRTTDGLRDRVRPYRDRLTAQVPALTPYVTRRPAIRSLRRQREFWSETEPQPAPQEYAVACAQEILASTRGVVERGDPILEIGSGLGSTLAALVDAGFSNVTGVEINALAVRTMRKKYPQLFSTDVMVGPAENLLAGIADDSFGMVVAVRTLQHTHPDSAHLFGTIARISPVVVTIDEPAVLGRHRYPWDFAHEFAAYGFGVALQQPLVVRGRATSSTVLVLQRAR